MNQKFRIISKRGLALFLALMMCITMLPVTAMAAEGPAAQIGETTYSSIREAIEEVAVVEDPSAAETIVTVLRDTKESIVIPSGKKIKLDLSGVTLSDSGDHTITVEDGASLIVEGGTVDNTTHGKAALLNKGTAVLSATLFKRSAEHGQGPKDNGGNSYYTIDNQGSMTVVGATIQNSGKFSSAVRNLGDGTEGKGVLTISSGTLSGGLNTVKNDDYGTLTITGGEFDNSTQYAVMNWNVCTIEGGTFDGRIYNNVYEDAGKGELTVKGGSFNSDPAISSKGGSVSVTGGTFEGEVGVVLPEGFELDDNGSVIDLKEKNAAAMVEGIRYATLQEAITNCDSGSTVVLLKGSGEEPYAESIEIPAGKEITLNLDGHVLTGKEDPSENVITNSGTLTITGNGTVIGGNYTVQNKGTMAIENGTIINDSNVALKNDPNAVLTIAGGQIESANSSPLYADGTVAVRGGSFTGKEPVLAANLTIESGTFNAEIAKADAAANIVIRGGYFSNDVSEYCVDGMHAEEIKLADGSSIWQITEISAVARVTNLDGTTTDYKTLQEALDVGGEITLLENVKITETLRVTKSFTLNGDGHKITSEGTDIRTFNVNSQETAVASGLEMVIRNVSMSADRCVNLAYARNVKLTLDNVQMSANRSGITVYHAPGAVVEVTDSQIQSAERGINLEGANDLQMTLDNVKIQGADQGVAILDTTNAEINAADSQIQGRTGLLLQDSQRVAVNAETTELSGAEADGANRAVIGMASNVSGCKVAVKTLQQNAAQYAVEVVGTDNAVVIKEAEEPVFHANNARTGNTVQVGGITYAVPVGTATWTDAVAEVKGLRYQTLQEALDVAEAGDTATLLKNLEVSFQGGNTESAIEIPAGVTLAGADKTITITPADGFTGCMIGFEKADGAVLKNLTIDMEGKGRHAVNVWQSKEIAIENVTLKNAATAGMVVVGSKVTAGGITTEGNAWGAINVDKGSSFTLTGENSLNEDAQVWSEDYGTEGGSQITLPEEFQTVKVEEGKTHFTTRGTVVARIGEIGYFSLEAALAAAKSGDTVTLLKNLEVSFQGGNTESAIELPAGVTLAGADETITITPADGFTGCMIGFEKADGAALKNLTIDMEGKGRHAVNVWQSTEIAIENVTLKNAATAGMVVVGSEVTAGGITTEGNTWGAINVDKGSTFTLTGENSLTEEAKVWSEDYGTEGGSKLELAGYAVVKVEDGKFFFAPGEAVATVDGIGFTTVQAAVNAADGKEVVLEKDIAESIIVSGTVTLNLNGKTLSNEAGKHTVTVNAGAELTVTGEGTVDNTSDKRAAVLNLGTAHLNDAAFTRSAEDSTANSNTYYVIDNQGTMTINGAEVTSASTYSSMIRNLGNGTENKGVLTIENGKFEGGLNTVKNDDYGTLTIHGGEFSNSAQHVVMNWNVAEITGGTFVCTAGGYSAVSNNLWAGHEAESKAELNISGGEFTAQGDTASVANSQRDAGGSIVITAGDFSSDVAEYCDTAYGTKEAEGRYVVLPRAAARVLPQAADAMTYTGEAQALAVAGAAEGGRFEYSRNGTDWSTTIPTGTNAGEYTVSYRLIGDATHADSLVTGTLNSSISKADVTFTAPVQRRPIYSGNGEALLATAGSVTGPGVVTGCTFQYRLGEDGEWSAEIPTAVETGTYTVYYQVIGDENHNDSPVDSVEVILEPNTVTMSVVMANYTCGDNSVEPTVTKRDDAIGEITFEYSGDSGETWSSEKPLTAGTYLVRATMAAAGNYLGTQAISQPFTVSHSYTGEWRSNDNGHWHACVCGAEEDHAAHVEGTGVPSGNEMVYSCTVCGHEMRRETIINPNPNPIGPGPSGDDNNGGTIIDDGNNPLGGELPFDDVTEADAEKGIKGDWFAPAVRYVYTHNELMTGVTKNTFSPNSFLTRGQLVTILWRLEGSPAAAAAKFTDVAAGRYYATAVAWANANGIVTGYSDTIFRPDRNVSRQEAATILYRYAEYKKYDVSSYMQGVLLEEYEDKGDVSDYAFKAMQWANGSTMINGRTETTLVPKGTTKRSEAAKILMQFCETYKVFAETAQN